MERENIQFRTFASDSDSPLLEQYFHLRFERFKHFGIGNYIDGPDTLDKHQDTRFVLAVYTDNDGHESVVGGLRFIVHRPYSDIELPVEGRASMSVAEIFPHLDTDGLTYAEITGICTAKGTKELGILKDMRVFAYSEASTDITLFVSNLVLSARHNAQNAEEAAIESGRSFAIRRDISTDDGKRAIITMSNDSRFPVVSETMEKEGIGIPNHAICVLGSPISNALSVNLQPKMEM